ncbi:MAG: hypothetical protein NTU98_15325 [Bacteroidetes bacterium]|nr:hypothetical protein [Bacteroidota bacterium]
MRYLLPLFLFLLTVVNLAGQNQAGTLEGTVTFVTSQNVYVKFSSTEKIRTGDTLFVKQGETVVPALIVKALSSISCVCAPVSDLVLKVSDKILFRPSMAAAAAKEETVPVPVVNPPAPATQPAIVPGPDTTTSVKPSGYRKKQQIRGFVNLSSFSGFTNYSSGNLQSEKLTFSLSARNIGNTNLSVETYMSYIQNDKQVTENSNSVFNKLKIYNLDIAYDFGKRATLVFGRKINPKLSNMGSNDGIQFELKFKPLSIGIIAGFRPDYKDYGFNSSLLQYGAYLFNEYIGKKGFMQSTLAFINQTNSGNTDRRYFYLQHVNSLVKNLTFFGSADIDIYGKEFNSADSTYTTTSSPKLTNLYLSLSYRILRRLGITLSYSDRQNVIYYETYKTYLETLLDNPSLHGYNLQVNYSPVNKLSIGATGSYRTSSQDPKPTENIYVYLTYSEIPGIKTGVTVSTIFLRTGYLNGKIYSAGLSKDIAAGKLYLGLTYRYVDYHYFNTEIIPTYQNMGEFSLTWRIIRKLSLSAYYEGTFEKINTYQRLYAQINWGF